MLFRSQGPSLKGLTLIFLALSAIYSLENYENDNKSDQLLEAVILSRHEKEKTQKNHIWGEHLYSTTDKLPDSEKLSQEAIEACVDNGTSDLNQEIITDGMQKTTKISIRESCTKKIFRLRREYANVLIKKLVKDYTRLCKIDKDNIKCSMIKRQVSEQFGCVKCKCNDYCKLRKRRIRNRCPSFRSLKAKHCSPPCTCEDSWRACLLKNYEKSSCTTQCPLCQKCLTSIKSTQKTCKLIWFYYYEGQRTYDLCIKRKNKMINLCDQSKNNLECLQKKKNCKFRRVCRKYQRMVRRCTKIVIMNKQKH